MNAANLAVFVSNIMSLTATTSGMGGASSGILGTTSASAPSVQHIKKLVMEFAPEYRKDASSETTLRLGKEIEGLLPTLQVMSVISNERCDSLLADLHDLIEQP